MRILVDHSGYELLNIGDIAMLQVCVSRLQNLWPNADIGVLTRSPERLEQYCPGAIAVAPDNRFSRRPERVSTSGGPRSEPRRLLRTLRRADIVVSSGGGFLNDTFWKHGARVLTLMAIAQRLGKPTAVFSQGIGPLTHPVLGRLVKLTMPRLQVIGLREGLSGVPLLKARGVNQELIQVTGDDALLLATTMDRPRTGTAIGLNVRVAPYSEVDKGVANQVVTATSEAASRRGVTTLALPVSRYKDASDLDFIRTSSDGCEVNAAGHHSGDVRSPAELTERAARCRVVVTGSYHAAVFGLAAGVPAVCITNSRYYDLKFEGLGDLFPGGCHIVRPQPHFHRELSGAIDRAWETSESDRDQMHSAAQAQVAQADQIYARFKSLVAATLGPVNEL